MTRPLGAGGFEPAPDSAARRALFDIRRQVIALNAGNIALAKYDIGEIREYASAAAVPAGFLECDGTTISRATYAALFAAIGITWGSGDGSTTFEVPDLQQRFVVGAEGALGYDVGTFGGSDDAVVVSHTHADTLAAPAHIHSVNPPNTSVSFGTTIRASNQNFASGGSSYVSAGAFGTIVTAAVNIAAFNSAGASATALTGSITAEGVTGTNANRPRYAAVVRAIFTGVMP